MRESFVLAFAGGDGQSEPILRRRQRTGGVRSESAGRILRFVEVQNHAAILGRIRIEKPRGRVRGLATGLVAEHEEETPALSGSLQAVGDDAALELHIAGAFRGFLLADDGIEYDLGGGCGGDELGLDLPILRHRIPAQMGEFAARLAVVVLETNAQAGTSLDEQ